MSIEYDIIIDKKIVLAKGSGVITGIDVIRHLDALAVDDRYKNMVPFGSVFLTNALSCLYS